MSLGNKFFDPGDSVGATQLSELSDVNTSTPTDKNVLVGNGIDFESRPLVEADISDLQAYLTSVADSDVGITNLLGAPTYDNQQDFNTITSSNGIVSGGIITDGGLGTADISATTFLIRSTDDPLGPLFSGDLAAQTGVALTDNSVNFIYIDYNAGTPNIQVSTTVLATVYDHVLIGIVYREGTTLHISQVNVATSQVAQSLGRRLALVNGVTRQTGLTISETGTRNIASAAGAVWLALDSYSLSALDTSVADTFIYYYDDGAGGHTAVPASTQISNTQYDDGSGTLANLSNNKYGVHWVYRGIDGDFYVVYGRGDYLLSEAQAAQPLADLPLHLTTLHTVLCAKIIIQKDGVTFTEIEDAFATTFMAGTPINHSELGLLTEDDHTQYVLNQRYIDFSIPAGAMRPLGTNGAEASSVEDLDAFAFDASTEEGVTVQFRLPDDYAGGALRWGVDWDAVATATGTAVFGLSGAALDDSDPLNTALGTERTITDTLLTVGDRHKSPNDATGITLAGTPAAGEFVKLKLVVKTTGTIAVDVLVLALQLQYQSKTTRPAVFA